MTTSCVACGCTGVLTNRLHQCDDPSCCCADVALQTMEMLAARVRYAMEAIDLDEMARLLAPDARWGAPEQEVPTCRNAIEILSWYEMARANGIRADITEVTVVGENIVIGLIILAPAVGKKKAKDQERWQVLSVRDGRIAEIRGYQRRGEAQRFATSGVSNWAS
jgi:hypothetical protein